MASLRAFMKNQIRQVISMCPGTKDFPVREDVMVDYYAATLEMLLEKCFFTKEQLSREEALQAVRFQREKKVDRMRISFPGQRKIQNMKTIRTGQVCERGHALL